MTTLYGINNCDTVKKAMKWLDSHQIDFKFHDFKKQGLSQALLTQLLAKSDWTTLINKRSTSYRNLSAELKENLTGDIAFNTVIDLPTLIKRPVLLHNNQVYVGFAIKNYQELFHCES